MPKQNNSKLNSKSSDAMHSVPVAYNKPTLTRKPKISGNPYAENGSIRVKHSEFLSDIFGQPSFSNQSISINPGLPTTFPWLSSIANNFESYKFHSLKFRYEPVCTTVTPGSVMMAVDFDASDAPATTKQALMSYHNAVRTAAWDCNVYSSSKQDLLKFGVQRYVRNTNVPNTDIKTYDVGNFQIATILASQIDSSFGELYIDYDVELMTPQTSNTSITGAAAQFVKYNLVGPSSDPTVTEDNFVGSGPITYITSTGPSTKGRLNFNFTGQYLITVFRKTGSSTGDLLLPATGSNTSVYNFGYTSSNFGSTVPYIVNVTALNGYVEFAAVATTVDDIELRVTVYPLPLV